MFLLKNHPKTMKNRPKSRPTMFLLDLLYKTVLWCFLFDFMLISNGTVHSFIVFLYIKEEINFLEYFWKTCKKPLFKQNFGLIKVNFRRLWLKNRPNGEILPNLVTLAVAKRFSLFGKKDLNQPQWSAYAPKHYTRVKMFSEFNVRKFVNL